MRKARGHSQANQTSSAAAQRKAKGRSEAQGSSAAQSVAGFQAGDNQNVSLSLNSGTPGLAQRKQVESLNESSTAIAQREKSRSLQLKADTTPVQKQADDEELLQGKFSTAQLVEDEEMLQGKFDTAQLAEEEELLQGKFETTQLAEEEELLQGKFETTQLVEEEDLLQGKFQTAQLKDQASAEGSPAGGNKTGLPDNLKSGIESMSGVSMDGVKVHYNSAKPAELNAHAYAQGSDIHVASGQEKHLPHEAWHVVQQAQGRVKPTTQAKGVSVNDDASLEKEADELGAKALQAGEQQSSASSKKA